MSRLIAVEPQSGRFESLKKAVLAAGGTPAPLSKAEALIWADPAKPTGVAEALELNPELSWVALPFAGIEPYVPYLDHQRAWTCARAVYARPVAEHVVALALAGFRGLLTYSRADRWTEPIGMNLLDAKVTIFGGGGIALELIRLLSGFNCDITIVRRNRAPIAGAARVLSLDQRLQALADADLVVLALALTPETRHVISHEEFRAMQAHAWLVNVARGGHVDSEALLKALVEQQLAGACLDVTEPEPLPAGHLLWQHPNVIITPHVGNTPEMGVPLLARHITENVKRYIAGQDLLGLIDVDSGY